MTKKDLIICMNEKTGMKRKDLKNVIESFMDIVSESLQKGENVTIKDFGKFYACECAERKIFSVHEKKIVNIPARKAPRFKASKNMKTFVRGE